MFIPNQVCEIYSPSDEMNLYGESVGEVRRIEKCAIVKLTVGGEKTSVRADSSASRGAAREIVADARLLMMPNSKVEIGDRVVLLGQSLRVLDIFPRHNITGRLEHLQVDLDVWAA